MYKGMTGNMANSSSPSSWIFNFFNLRRFIRLDGVSLPVNSKSVPLYAKYDIPDFSSLRMDLL